MWPHLTVHLAVVAGPITAPTYRWRHEQRGGVMTRLLIITIAVIVTVFLAFAWALCRAAAMSDRAVDEYYNKKD